MDAIRKNLRVQIIACSVFEEALKDLGQRKRLPAGSVCFLPSHLHLYAHELQRQLLETVTRLKKYRQPIVLLYGTCFPDIDSFCKDNGIYRIRGPHCFEMMLGSDRYDELLEESAGTYFLDQDLVRNFRSYCIEPLELDDTEMRVLYFRHYTRLMYLHQPADTDLTSEIAAVGRFLNLPVQRAEVDYEVLERRIREVIATIISEQE